MYMNSMIKQQLVLQTFDSISKQKKNQCDVYVAAFVKEPRIQGGYFTMCFKRRYLILIVANPLFKSFLSDLLLIDNL